MTSATLSTLSHAFKFLVGVTLKADAGRDLVSEAAEKLLAAKYLEVEAACLNCGHVGDHDDNDGFCKVCGEKAEVARV